MRIGKERCERKTYPHRVYPDRNRIRLRVNGALVRCCSESGDIYTVTAIMITSQTVQTKQCTLLVYTDM